MPWTDTDLARLGGASDVAISVAAPDGDFPKRTVVWVVRAGDALYIRPYVGPQSRWFAAAVTEPRGRLHADGTATDVTLTVLGDDAPNDEIDAAYEAKYGQGPHAGYVAPMCRPGPRAATVRLDPR